MKCVVCGGDTGGHWVTKGLWPMKIYCVDCWNRKNPEKKYAKK